MSEKIFNNENYIKSSVLLCVVGLLLGFSFGALGPVVGLGIVFLVAAAGIVLARPNIAVCILACYSFIDYILRLVADGLIASLWDEAYLCGLVMLWICKWIINRKSDGFKTSPMDLPIVIFIGVMFFMMFFNYQQFNISVEGFRAIVQYILWFFVVLQLVDNEQNARSVTVVFVLVAGIMAMHGVFQYIVGAEMPAGWIDQNEMSVRTRVYSILTSPNIFGSMMTLSTPMAVSLALEAKHTKGKVVFGFLALMMIASLVFTFSRGAWIGFMVAAAVYVLLKDKRLIIPCIILAVAVLICVPSVGNRISYMLSPEYIESSLRGGRLVRWLTGLEILKFYPWMGVGLGQFGGAVAMNHSTEFLVGYEHTKTFYMDNYFLKTAVESGIIGFAAFVMLMYSVIINSYRTVKEAKSKTTRELATGIMAGLCGVITHNWVENIFEVPLMTTLFWIFAAVIMVLYYNERKADRA